MDATVVATPLIQPIAPSSIQCLVAGQAITNLSSAVKELVDNAIDAGCTRVTIKLHDQGLKAIEVSDNGTGVPSTSRPLMAMKHATSKLRKFDDLYSQEVNNDNGIASHDTTRAVTNNDDCAPTLGFRGEALFCLANISRSLQVSTRTIDEDCLGEQFSFNTQGELMSNSIIRVPRPVGTTVYVRGLFETLPVRRVDLCKRIKGQRMKLMKMMQGYAILCLGTQFQIIDVQSSKNEDKSQSSKNKNKSKSLLATSESSITFETRTSSILGSKFLAGLTNMDIDLSGAVNSKLTYGDGEEGVDKTTSSSGKWKLQGLISHSPTSPHSTNARDLQFFSINGRPVDLPSVSRLLGDVWRLFDPTSESKGSISSSSVGRRRCACILAFTLPNNMYDVNLSPDKREVMFTEESAMLDLIRDGLMTLWSSQSEGKFAANEVESVKGSNEKISSAVDDNGTKIISATASKAKDDEINNVTPKLRRRNTDGNPMVTPHDPNCFKRVSNNNTYRPDINDVPSRMQRVTLSQSQSQHEEKQEDSTPQIDHSDSDNGRQQSRSSLNRVKLPERSREKDRRGWEQMRINFQQIEKSQLQQDMGCVLPFNVNDNAMQNNNDKHVLTATIKPISKSDRSVLRSQRKRQKPDAASFLNSLFAYGVTTQPAAEDDEDDGSEGEDLHREVENSETINVRKIVEISREPSWRVDSGIRDARMVVGNILVAGKSPCSRDAGHESTLLTQSASKASSTEEADDSDIERNSKLPQVAIWNSFSGTQVVIALSQQARLMMQDTRKNLHSSVKKRKRASRCDGQISDADKNTTVNLCKEDFLHMLIIGQFNLGFILALCRNNNLWILDQHACDEKYNFERLCKETVIHEQKLIAPLPLELSPSEEHCVLDNMDVFERNGFCFSYDPEKQPRHRLSLTALPHSGSGADGKKAVQFGKEDVGALCAMLGADGTSSAEGYIAGFEGADGSRIAGVNAVRRYAGSDTRSDGIVGSSIVRLPKAIAMFASRACRGSIMIGMALSHKEQESILKKLDKTDIPWNCAHGRPTMSHVRSLTECLLDDNEAIAAHVASPSLSIV